MANFFQALGQSNVNQSLGMTLEYLQRERATQVAEKRTELEEQRVGSALETDRLQRNQLQMQIEEATRLREKVSVDKLMTNFPFKGGESEAFMLRNAKMMGLIDPDGFTTKADLQKLGEFMRSPEVMKTMNRLVVNDADATVAKLQGLLKNPDAMKESGMKPEDVQTQLQQAYAMQEKVHTAYSNLEETERMFNGLPDAVQLLARQEGIDPTRIKNPAKMAAIIGANVGRWRRQLVREQEESQIRVRAASEKDTDFERAYQQHIKTPGNENETRLGFRNKWSPAVQNLGVDAEGNPILIPTKNPSPEDKKVIPLSKEQSLKLREGRAVVQSAIDDIENIQDLVGNSASVIGGLGKAQSKLDSWSNQLSALATKLGGTAELNGYIVKDSKLLDPNKYKFDSLAPDARKSAQTKSLLVKLGYSIARTNNPDGRISDADVQLAIDSLGGSTGSPQQLHAVLDGMKSATVRDFNYRYKNVAGKDPDPFTMKYPNGFVFKGTNVPPMEEWLIQAKKVNPTATPDELILYYTKKYGGK